MYLYIYISISTYKYAAISNGKWKPRLVPLILIPFADRANGSLSFVCVITKKQTEVFCLQTD